MHDVVVRGGTVVDGTSPVVRARAAVLAEEPVGQARHVNIVDLEELRLLPPRWAADPPAGGRRPMPDVEGYRATFLAGTTTWSDGEPTGERPGRAVRAVRATGRAGRRRP